MDSIIFFSIALLLFLVVCAALRFFASSWVEEWDFMECVWFLIFIPLTCLFWPVTLPMFILGMIGAFIMGFFKKGRFE